MCSTTCIHDTFISTILTMHSTMSSTTPGLYPCAHHDMYPRHSTQTCTHVIHDTSHDTHPRHLLSTMLSTTPGLYPLDSNLYPCDPRHLPRHAPTTLDSNLYPCDPRYIPRHPSTTCAIHDVVHDTWFVPMCPRCSPRHELTTLDTSSYPCNPRHHSTTPMFSTTPFHDTLHPRHPSTTCVSTTRFPRQVSTT